LIDAQFTDGVDAFVWQFILNSSHRLMQASMNVGDGTKTYFVDYRIEDALPKSSWLEEECGK
jgi:hypothetical protein